MITLRPCRHALITAAAFLAACGGSSQAQMGAPGAMAQSRIHNAVPLWQAQHVMRAACPRVAGNPTCLSQQVTKDGIVPLCSPSSSCGFTPSQLETAYGLTGSLGKGSGQIVAVIEAGDLADASSDLSTYRGQYGLGTASFVKYNENGQQSNYPPSCEDYGWCIETDLDIDMVSASCPKCTIYLMETKGAISNFEAAEAEAVTLGATILSNSWTCYASWDCDDANFPNYFDTPGVAYLASTSGGGYDSIGAPAALASVIAVGGTQLTQNGSKYSESIWNESGSGCASPGVVGSPGVPKPSWQHDPDCSYRTLNDVSAESGCSPGVAVYSSIYGGWTDVCGTSVASPFTAGVIGLAGNASSWDADGGKHFWTLTSKEHKKWFHHPTNGNNGQCANYLCGNGRYKKYYSGPGGWGTPNGIRGY